jgi:hypothetical protein
MSSFLWQHYNIRKMRSMHRGMERRLHSKHSSRRRQRHQTHALIFIDCSFRLRKEHLGSCRDLMETCRRSLRILVAIDYLCIKGAPKHGLAHIAACTLCCNQKKATRAAPPIRFHQPTKPQLHSLQRSTICLRAILLHTIVSLRIRGT